MNKPITPQQNTMTGAEAVVELLKLHGVEQIFGLCGDTSLPFYDALHRLDHGMSHILTRDERHACYMADGYARVTHKVGVCEGPSGGGATYILPGLVEAGESSIPVFAITTDVAVPSAGRFPLTELDQEALMKPLTKWNKVANTAQGLPTNIRSAFRAMTTGTPGSAHLGLPFDVQKAAVDPSDVWAQKALGSYPAWPAAPDPKEVERFVGALMTAENPIIICGGGIVIAQAEAELQRLAERLDLVIATTVSGQGSLSELHPNCLGVVGSNGGVLATREIVQEADLIVFIGCRAGSVTTERWRYPQSGTKVLHIDSNPIVISANYHTDVALVSDARLALSSINAALDADPQKKVGFGGAARVAKAVEAKFARFNSLAQSDETPIRPECVVSKLNALLPDDAIIVADPGTPCPYFSAYFRLARSGRHFFSNRAHGALGYSLAGSMGAQVGRPNAKVVSVMGDGSFGFSVGELETVVRLNLPITFIVFSNAVYGWIKAGQKTGFDERYFSVDFSRTDHARVAEAYGVRAFSVMHPGELKGALRQAIAHDGPTLVDVISQPLQEANAPVSEWIA